MRALWLFSWTTLLLAVHLPAGAELFKTVDAAGNVTYTDRPQVPGQEALRLPPPNVSTPEARRQLALAEQRLQQEAQSEYAVRMNQWAAAQRTPVGYSRTTISPSRAYSTYATPGFYTIPTYLVTNPNAGSPSQSRPSQGLRPSSVSHRAHHARR